MNRSMPPGAVIPVLIYPDVRDAVEWLCRSFGFVERLRIGTHRSQLAVGAGSVLVTEQRAEPGAARPATSAAVPAESPVLSIMVRIEDVQKHYAHTRRLAARIISPPADYPYGERQYTVEDLAGYRWIFSQTLEDVDPADWGGTLFG
ncbi:MAG TPA: VOC family protein [Steroidobacteraceae bacterium]|nr:VOC family protein [Steroidobacteraceae bacterium]